MYDTRMGVGIFSMSWILAALCSVGVWCLEMPAPLVVNESPARAMIALVNHERSSPLHPLTLDTQLSTIAEERASAMAHEGRVYHENGGTSYAQLLAKNRYAFVRAGENVAVGSGNIEALHHSWMDSPRHRANILNPFFTAMGFGIATGTIDGQVVVYAAQIFATPQPP